MTHLVVWIPPPSEKVTNSATVSSSISWQVWICSALSADGAKKCTSWHGTLQYSDDLLPWLRCRGMEVTNVLVDAKQIMFHVIVTHNVPPALICDISSMNHTPVARRAFASLYILFVFRLESCHDIDLEHKSPQRRSPPHRGVQNRSVPTHTHLHNKT